MVVLAATTSVLFLGACSDHPDQGQDSDKDPAKSASAAATESALNTGEPPTAATVRYQRYITQEARSLLESTRQFVERVKSGDAQGAKTLYPVARTHWERIEPVAESFGDLDPKIDGREEVIADGMAFTGFHRLERDLWVDGLQPDSGTVADQLLADVTDLVQRAPTVELTALQLANGAKELLDEVATGKITGEEDRYSHTDLWDFRANVDGSAAAIAALRPLLASRAPDLLASVDERFRSLGLLLEQHRYGDGYVLYTTLDDDEVRRLSAAVDAVSEPVSQVADIVAEP
jgi:iron uptake system component EfeO